MLAALPAVHHSARPYKFVAKGALPTCKCIGKRGAILGFLGVGQEILLLQAASAALNPRFLAAFNDALKAGGSFEAGEAAWSKVIALDEKNSIAWSNRGTHRLQYNLWQDALSDLKVALELETKGGREPSPLLLVQLGNAEGSVGNWAAACQRFDEASRLGPELESIALANLALAYCEIGRDSDAVNTARKILRKDAEFLDARCALTAFLWASGKHAEAEGEWTQLQDSQDGVGAMLYGRAGAVERVRGRWPPRPVAALKAFLNASNRGDSIDYSGNKVSYEFV